jgi:hypothetical protein
MGHDAEQSRHCGETKNLLDQAWSGLHLLPSGCCADWAEEASCLPASPVVLLKSSVDLATALPASPTALTMASSTSARSSTLRLSAIKSSTAALVSSASASSYARQSKDKTMLAYAAALKDRATRRLGKIMDAQRKTVGLAKAGDHQKSGYRKTRVMPTASIST